MVTYPNNQNIQFTVEFFYFAEQVKLSPDVSLKVDSDDPSTEYLIRLIEEKTGSKVMEHELSPEVDANLATKFGQKITSSSQVSMK